MELMFQKHSPTYYVANATHCCALPSHFWKGQVILGSIPPGPPCRGGLDHGEDNGVYWGKNQGMYWGKSGVIQQSHMLDLISPFL